jgi:hypothetical protein
MTIYILVQSFAFIRFIKNKIAGNKQWRIAARQTRIIPVIRECCFPLQATQYLLQCDQPHNTDAKCNHDRNVNCNDGNLCLEFSISSVTSDKYT